MKESIKDLILKYQDKIIGVQKIKEHYRDELTLTGCKLVIETFESVIQDLEKIKD